MPDKTIQTQAAEIKLDEAGIIRLTLSPAIVMTLADALAWLKTFVDDI